MKRPRLGLLLLPSLATLAVLARAEVLERVIVKVNGEIVTQSEFEARQLATVQAARVPAAEVSAYLRQHNAKILQEAIDDLLLAQRAAELGYKISAQYLQDVVEGIKKENKIATDEELEKQLRREGMSVQDLKRNIERQVLKRQVLQRDLEAKSAVSEAEARADYEARKAEYTRPESLQLHEIVIRADVPSAAALAAEVVKRARAGEDFGELAKSHSAGPTAGGGGDLGRFGKGDLAPDVERVAFSLEAGGVSDPIPVTEGYRILRVSDKAPGSVTPFEEARADIMRRLGQGRAAQAYESYMEGLRKAALVDLRVREVPLDVAVPSTPPLEVPALDKPAPVGGSGEDPNAEVVVSPPTRPERVRPPALPGEPTPSPSPSPSPPPQG